MKKNNSRYWRIEKLKRIAAIGAEVMLPFGEEGLVVDYENLHLCWFPFKVKITKGDIFNEIGSIAEFKSSQIIFNDNKIGKMF